MKTLIIQILPFFYTPLSHTPFWKNFPYPKNCVILLIFLELTHVEPSIRFLDENRLEFCNFQQFRQFRLFRSNLSDAIFQPIFKISKNRLADLIFPLLAAEYWLEKDFWRHHYQNVLILPDSYRESLISNKTHTLAGWRF